MLLVHTPLVVGQLISSEAADAALAAVIKGKNLLMTYLDAWLLRKHTLTLPAGNHSLVQGYLMRFSLVTSPKRLVTPRCQPVSLSW